MRCLSTIIGYSDKKPAVRVRRSVFISARAAFATAGFAALLARPHPLPALTALTWVAAGVTFSWLSWQRTRALLDRMATDGTFEKMSKKEVSRLRRERERLEFAFSGIKEMPGLPSLVFVIDTKKEKIAVAEANRLGVPIVGIVDTNCDPTVVNFPIPGNDDAIRAIRLFTRMVADTVLEARSFALEGADQQTVSFGGEETGDEAQAAIEQR